MTLPRKMLVCVEDTPYYHVVSRCVRRGYLCGVDNVSGKNYEYRRQWIENRIRILSSLFAIDLCAYAVMSNHFHLVIKLCPEEVERWSNEDVLERWTSLFKGPPLVQRWKKGESLGRAEQQVVSDCIAQYRQNLGSLSWFMKCLNEPIARQANREDKCTGHFWESRFKSQALLTEEALLSCMAYVDLNPIRANIAKTPEYSQHTSIQERIAPKFNLAEAVKQQVDYKCLRSFELPLKALALFEGGTTEKKQGGILFDAKDYMELVDYTARIIRPDKKGAIPLHVPPILDRLNLSKSLWVENTLHFERDFYRKFGCNRHRFKNTG